MQLKLNCLVGLAVKVLYEYAATTNCRYSKVNVYFAIKFFHEHT